MQRTSQSLQTQGKLILNENIKAGLAQVAGVPCFPTNIGHSDTKINKFFGGFT